MHFQSVTEGITLDDSPTGTVMAQIMMVFAQFERETIQRRVTDNYFARAKTGIWAAAPRSDSTKAKRLLTEGGQPVMYPIPNRPH